MKIWKAKAQESDLEREREFAVNKRSASTSTEGCNGDENKTVPNDRIQKKRPVVGEAKNRLRFGWPQW